MLDCSKCQWSHPETCKVCKAERLEQRTLEVAQQIVKVKQVDKFDYYHPEKIEVFVN